MIAARDDRAPETCYGPSNSFRRFNAHSGEAIIEYGLLPGKASRVGGGVTGVTAGNEDRIPLLNWKGAALRELRERLRPNAPDCVQLDELSMGMSGDFEVAIREGATIVRIGSLLWDCHA